MQYGEFVERFMAETGLEDRADAERIVTAILEVLGERTPRTERRQLATQLPKELGEAMRVGKEVQHFSLEDFYNRVRARADVGGPAAERCSHALMAVLQEAVTSGELEDVREELGPDFRPLFEETG